MIKILLFALVSSLAASAGGIEFHRTPGRIDITLDGQPLTRYFYGTEWSTPFLHPLRTPAGVIVTRGYPVEQIGGESNDHIWHHGLWYSHGDINGVDFWRDLGPVKTGRMVISGSPSTKGSTLTATVLLVTPAKSVIGSVIESFRFSRSSDGNIVDATFTIRADRGMPLKMGDTEEGTMGIRLADEFRVDRGAILLNSEGVTGREIWGKRARWVDYATTIQGQKVGIRIEDNPKNPKHPSWWHARHYAFAAVNPFGVHDFERDKTKDGSMTIPAGKTLRFRYRVVIR